jgi:hypothetical protein
VHIVWLVGIRRPVGELAQGPAAVADRPAARQTGRGDRRAWEARSHPVVISAVLTALGAVVWVTVFPRVGTDLSAAMARAGWASRYPGAAYLFSWYGGFHPAGYSLLAPYLLAVVGVRLAMAAAAVLSAVLLSSLLVRHRIPRPRAAAAWVAIALWTELSAGRAPFTLGLAAGLGCVVAAGIRRPVGLLAAAALALLTGLLSPVAALFLLVVAAAFAVARRRAEAAVVAVAAGLPLSVMAVFSDGGTQPFTMQNWLPPLVAAAGVLLLVPRRWRMVRAGAVVYGLGVLLTLAVPSLIGSNVARLGELLIGPLLVGMGSPPQGRGAAWTEERGAKRRATREGGASRAPRRRAGGTARRRWLLAPALIAAAVWQVAQPAADLAQGNAPPFAPQTAALVRELGALHADTARVEAVPQYGHWESQELADAAPLARGWERQLDIERNPLFYDGSLDPATYRDWLRYDAVRYVALSTATPDPAAAGEASIIRAGQPWLIPVWHDAFWQLYQVTGASPLASPPATVTGTTPAQITLRMTRAGTTLVRVHWSRWLRAPGAVVAQRGPWTSLTVSRPGRYVLSAPY